MIRCVYTETEKPVKPGLGQVQRPCFNLDWMTNQPYITREELAGNQCVCPPILHQYSVSFAHHMPGVFAVFLYFLFFPFSPPLILSLFSRSLCSVVLWKHTADSISILRTPLFLCFVFKWSGSQAEGCNSGDGRDGGRGGRRGGELAFGVRFPLEEIFTGR